MGSLPELRYLDSPRHAPRRSFGAATGLQVRPPAGRGGKYDRGALRLDSGQALTPALLEIHAAAGRRRESCSSSVGAASVRRLVRGGGGGGGARAPRQEDELRAAWMRRAAAACVARAFAAAALLPLMAIQGSMSPWSNGPVLLSALHGASALSALASPALLRAATPCRALTLIYFLLAVFFPAHLVPELYILLPLYLAAGLCWTPLLLAHDSILGELACEGNFQTLPPHNPHGAVSGLQSERRTLLRRLTRASRIARDTGLLFAALMLPLIPSRTVVSSPSIISDFNNTNCLLSPPCSSELYGMNNASILVESVFIWEESKSKQNATDKTWIPIETEEELEGWREEACGSRGCPGNDIPDGSDCREEISMIDDIPYCLCLFCLLASLLSLWCWTEGRGRGAPPAGGPLPWRAALMAITDPRMRLAGPLAFFIGLEQGFLYAHFLKWYVVCVGGGSQVWSVLAAVAVLRSLVSATLSMLLAHGRRRLVAGGGLVWHACLLLALGAWKAARADMQLPPVMAAAWAGCGAVWDLLLPTLVDEPVPAGRAALALSFRAIGLSLAFLARSTLCARWALRALFLALPAAALPLLFAPDR